MKEENMVAMTADAVRAKEEYLFTVGAKAQEKIDRLTAPVLFEDKNGEQYIYCDGNYELVEERKPDHIIAGKAMKIFTLDGLIDYILKDPERRFCGTIRHMVRVISPTEVDVVTEEIGYWKERETVAYCVATIPTILFGKYMPAEDFQVMVQTSFEDSENRDIVLKLAGSVRKEQNMQTADDGVSQKVTINSGVSTAADVIVKNPVTLTPYRTFHEVKQPESPFVLRFDEEGQPALFTGDGSKWQLEAVAAIREYLKWKLQGANVDIIA